MRFEFATTGRILFGVGTLKEVPVLARELGQRALIVTGRSTTRAEALRTLLVGQSVESVLFSVPGEPSLETVTTGVEQARQAACDQVIGIGGGSALDAGKAIAAMLTNQGDLLDYLEVIGKGQPLKQSSAPFIAIPTTAGTGTEVTRNAVLFSPAHRVKVSLRSPFLLPRVAVVDPELTYLLPPSWTAATGLDALTQLIEPYISNRANPLADGFCVAGLQRVGRSLKRAYEEGQDPVAREEMALAGLLGGLALANAGLGVVHAIASPLGGMFSAPHGAICAALLPHAMRVNVRALRERTPDSEFLRRHEKIARLLTGHELAKADDGVRWVSDLCGALSIPPLRTYGMTVKDIPPLVEKTARANSMKTNPVALTPEELAEILVQAI